VQQLADGVHIVDAEQRFFGVEVGARMTVLQTDAGVLVHSPVAVDPAEVQALGPLRWAVAPNKLHHLYVGSWAEAGAQTWAAPGLPAKRADVSFAGVLDGETQPFGDDIEVIATHFFALTNEVLLLHRPSRTLVVTDLVFHFTRDAPWLTRAAMACAGGYPGCRTTVLERVGFSRSVARRELGQLLQRDFDRLVMAHGEVIDSGGKQALREALGWLGL